MFGLVFRSTMDAAVERERAAAQTALAREREVAVEATASAFEYYKAAQVAEERAAVWERRARRLRAKHHELQRAMLAELKERAADAMTEAPKPSAPPKPAPQPMPFVLQQHVVGWDEPWAREDVHELLDEARLQAGGDWNAVVGPATDPAAGIVSS